MRDQIDLRETAGHAFIRPKLRHVRLEVPIESKTDPQLLLNCAFPPWTASSLHWARRRVSISRCSDDDSLYLHPMLDERSTRLMVMSILVTRLYMKRIASKNSLEGQTSSRNKCWLASMHQNGVPPVAAGGRCSSREFVPAKSPNGYSRSMIMLAMPFSTNDNSIRESKSCSNLVQQENHSRVFQSSAISKVDLRSTLLLRGSRAAEASLILRCAKISSRGWMDHSLDSDRSDTVQGNAKMSRSWMDHVNDPDCLDTVQGNDKRRPCGLFIIIMHRSDDYGETPLRAFAARVINTPVYTVDVSPKVILPAEALVAIRSRAKMTIRYGQKAVYGLLMACKICGKSEWSSGAVRYSAPIRLVVNCTKMFAIACQHQATVWSNHLFLTWQRSGWGSFCGTLERGKRCLTATLYCKGRSANA